MRRPLNRVHLTRLCTDQEGLCPACGRPLPDPFERDSSGPLIEVDHVRPLSRGGADHLSNLQALHRECHAEKTASE